MTMRDDPMHVPPHHRLDISSEPGILILRRSRDGTEVARFSASGASWEEIPRAAEEDHRATGED
jgi:hypothetical protein